MVSRPTGNPVGRPTKYTPEFSDNIIELMASGLSLAASAGELDVSRDTVYRWRDEYPDFGEAVRLAQTKRQTFLEKRLITATDGPVVTSSIFALKNAARADWSDRQTLEHTGADGGPVQIVTASADALKDELAAMAAKLVGPTDAGS